MADDTSGGKKRGGRNATRPPTMASVHNLFGDDVPKPDGSRVVIPPPGKSSKKGDKRNGGALITEDGDALRVGKRWSAIMKAVAAGEYTWEEFVGALDREELARGQIKATDGSFRGRPPQLVPRAFFNACTSEIMKRGREQWLQNYPEALRTINSIAADERVKPEVRLKAAFFVAERIEGKAVQPMVVSVEDPWQVALAGVVADVSEDAAIARAHDYTARQEAVDSFGTED